MFYKVRLIYYHMGWRWFLMRFVLVIFVDNVYISFIGRSIGLVISMTGVNSELISSIDLFYEHPNIHLTSLFAPEHGIRGDAKEGEKVASTIVPYTNVPVYSLYGKSRKPTKEMLDSVDVIIFDL